MEPKLTATADMVRQHLEGEITIGLYAINPTSQRSKWVVIDADYDLDSLFRLPFAEVWTQLRPHSLTGPLGQVEKRPLLSGQ